jgi:hypothetical protein
LLKFFVYLHAELNSQWSITESARIQATKTINQQKHKTEKKNEKIDQLRLFTFKYVSVKTSVDLQIAVAAETQLDERQ